MAIFYGAARTCAVSYVNIVAKPCAVWTYAMKNVNNVVERERGEKGDLHIFFACTCMESICLPLN